MFLECGVSVLGSQFSEMCTFLARKCTCSETQLKCIGNSSIFRQRSWHPGIHSVFRALAPTSVRQIWKILYFSVRNCYEIARIAEDFWVFWRIIGMRTRAMPRGQKRTRKEAPDMSVFRRVLARNELTRLGRSKIMGCALFCRQNKRFSYTEFKGIRGRCVFYYENMEIRDGPLRSPWTRSPQTLRK